MNKGTPKNLDEAIERMVLTIPACELREQGYCLIRDYLSQKFSIAILKYSHSAETVEVLQDLFKQLVKRDK